MFDHPWLCLFLLTPAQAGSVIRYHPSTLPPCQVPSAKYQVPSQAASMAPHQPRTTAVCLSCFLVSEILSSTVWQCRHLPNCKSEILCSYAQSLFHTKTWRCPHRHIEFQIFFSILWRCNNAKQASWRPQPNPKTTWDPLFNFGEDWTTHIQSATFENQEFGIFFQ